MHVVSRKPDGRSFRTPDNLQEGGIVSLHSSHLHVCEVFLLRDEISGEQINSKKILCQRREPSLSAEEKRFLVKLPFATQIAIQIIKEEYVLSLSPTCLGT